MDTYVIAKLKEAVALAKGNRMVAQRLMLDWTQRDPRLLQALTRNVVPALIARLVDRGLGITERSGTAEAGPSFRAERRGRTSAETLADFFGSGAPKFGMGSSDQVAGAPPATSGEGHASALRLMAAAQAQRRPRIGE